MSFRVSLDSSGDTPRCKVGGILDFNNAREVLTGVGELVSAHSVLDIDLSDVTQSNSAGLALLIEWLAMAKREGHTVTFHHIPDGLRQLAGVCQVDGLI